MVVIYPLISSLIYSQLVCLQATGDSQVKSVFSFSVFICFYCLTERNLLCFPQLRWKCTWKCLCLLYIHIYSVSIEKIILPSFNIVCQHVSFCTAFKQVKLFINCMELIEIFQICKGELWYETVSVKRLSRKGN